ncbi:hypothetical protein KC717_03740 [Candidatus Dojkabacteria bacterium]|uniref:Uncharacterized protein n=1 Tax=Candidatus Dojkabacteria bacterium TaxID=2099670 RepID=A0A955RKC6_9BACT|nr:hypothetical protein [Candidatus Dojkabacteria bacterium]
MSEAVEEVRPLYTQERTPNFRHKLGGAVLLLIGSIIDSTHIFDGFGEALQLFLAINMGDSADNE